MAKEKRSRLSVEEILEARLAIINRAIDQMAIADRAEVLKRAVREALSLSGREAVIFADYVKRQGELDV